MRLDPSDHPKVSNRPPDAKEPKSMAPNTTNLLIDWTRAPSSGVWQVSTKADAQEPEVPAHTKEHQRDPEVTHGAAAHATGRTFSWLMVKRSA